MKEHGVPKQYPLTKSPSCHIKHDPKPKSNIYISIESYGKHLKTTPNPSLTSQTKEAKSN